MHSGATEAIWVWHDGPAVDWHIRTTTAKHLHRFSGRVWVDKGSIVAVRKDALEGADRVREESNTVGFDFTTDGAIDGFDFRVKDAACIHLLLTIDGKPEVQRVMIGAKSEHPKAETFALCR